MGEVCGELVIADAYHIIRDACVVFSNVIRGIEEGGPSEPGTVITHGFGSLHTHLALRPIGWTVTASASLDEWVRRYAWPWERLVKADRELAAASAAWAAYELMASGATLVADMHFNEVAVGEVLERLGIRADLSVAVMDGGVFESFEEAVECNRELIRWVRGRETITARYGPCTPRLLTPEQYGAVVRLAAGDGVGVHTHIAEVPDDELYLLEHYGIDLRGFVEVTGLRTTNAVVAHAIWAYGSIEPSWARIAHSPRSNTALGDGKAPIVKYLARGFVVGLGVDVAPTYDIREEARAAYYLHSLDGLTKEDVYSMLTEGPYTGLGLGTGRLVEGEPADLVMWRVREGGDPISAILFGDAYPLKIFVGGRLVWDRGPLGISLDEIKEFVRLASSVMRRAT